MSASSPSFKSILFKRYGQLVVIAELSSDKCVARCDCGKVKEFWRSNLKQGRSTKCHPAPVNHKRKKLILLWHAMKGRCLNEDHQTYKYYGGRGITVCDRWLVFENFLADMGYAPKGMTLERKDNDGNYCPDNCRWATHQEQMRNTRQNVRLTFKGQTKTATEWASELGINRSTLYKRLNRSGWAIERALTS